MPSKHNIDIIKKGKDAWNTYKAEQLNIILDLTNADLSNTDFSGYNLENVDLSGAKLISCHFGQTRLFRVGLSGAILNDSKFFNCIMLHSDLSNAQLLNVQFSDCSLSYSGLTNANLTKAEIRRTNLISANLTKCNLSEAILSGLNFSNATCESITMSKAKLDNCNFFQAIFSGSNLIDCYMPCANLSYADFSNADFSESFLSGTNFFKTNLKNANLSKALLQKCIFVDTKVEGCLFTDSFIYGLSVWDLQGKPKDQSNLVITHKHRGGIVTVDDLEMGQFLYLLLNNEKLRNVIDTLTSKTVLILGRFTPERKIVLETLAEKVREHNLLPVIFDFEKATSRDFTETIKILAGMALFVIVDMTSPKSSPLELQATVPDYTIPFVPIIQDNEMPFSMFADLIGKYDWVLQPISYKSVDTLKTAFNDLILGRAIQKHKEIQLRRTKVYETFSADEYLKKSIDNY
ncbi:MAG: hypothetical protein BGP13_21830 [Sphingobacteriales bacterium 40-81]|nr:MAG: hypothetical protein BGP13_21830 [Sphingobacteriales bacterium 40-81]